MTIREQKRTDKILDRQRETRRDLRYRHEERLGILCGAAAPAPEQTAIAEQEARQWQDQQVMAQ